mmetsp:Transcript_4291/g.6115  ORF Transcript_4291/g.6115 Transcript_4291/m.6115 type:complete len:113 (+) Transcript_4291:469-807(+)
METRATVQRIERMHETVKLTELGLPSPGLCFILSSSNYTLPSHISTRNPKVEKDALKESKYTLSKTTMYFRTREEPQNGKNTQMMLPERHTGTIQRLGYQHGQNLLMRIEND